jgi:hypothetical protein
MARVVHTSLGDLCEDEVGFETYTTPWREWVSDFSCTPEVEFVVPLDGMDAMAECTLCLQIQAVPLWVSLRCPLRHGYEVSVPLDDVRDVSIEGGRKSQHVVRVGSKSNLFEEIMLRGVMSSKYAIRVFSVGRNYRGGGGGGRSGCRSVSRVSRGIPRVFVFGCDPQHRKEKEHQPRLLNISLSNSCLISHRQDSSLSPTPSEVVSIVNPRALDRLRNSVADALQTSMSSTLKVLHARISRHVLLLIADMVMPQIFPRHGWIRDHDNELVVDCNQQQPIFVLNSNGFPAFYVGIP